VKIPRVAISSVEGRAVVYDYPICDVVSLFLISISYEILNKF
jgi:hypothetical protein